MRADLCLRLKTVLHVVTGLDVALSRITEVNLSDNYYGYSRQQGLNGDLLYVRSLSISVWVTVITLRGKCIRVIPAKG